MAKKSWNNIWGKRVIVTNHVRERFEQRRIKYTGNQKKWTIESQIRYDLRPINILRKEKKEENVYKVTTKQGKVYIISTESPTNILVITVYKRDIREERLGYLDVT